MQCDRFSNVRGEFIECRRFGDDGQIQAFRNVLAFASKDSNLNCPFQQRPLPTTVQVCRGLINQGK